MKKQIPHYRALHYWVVRKLGNPKWCEMCGFTNKNKYEWANISREYKKDLKDWFRLCSSCHHKYDQNNVKIYEIARFRYNYI